MSFASLAQRMTQEKKGAENHLIMGLGASNNKAGDGSRLQVPGFGLSVNSPDPGTKYPSAITIDWSSEGVTLREKRMLAFIDSITDKPSWETKVFDDAIVAKWREETSVEPEHLGGDVLLSKEMFDFCIKELQDKAAIVKETDRVNIYDAEVSIVKSDTAVPETLRNALIEGVKVLEDVPDHKKDWHPGSGNKVLDLLHPSLFPVVFGLTKALPDEKVPLEGCLSYIGKGETTAKYEPPEGAVKEYGTFQWLPTDVQLTDSGAKLLGYINNLHPEQHNNLFKILEKMVDVAVPLWDECLSGYYERRRIILGGTGSSDYTFPQGLKYQIPGREGPNAWYDPISEETGEEEDQDDEDEEDEEDDGDDEQDDDWKYEFHFQAWKEENRILVQREPRDYIPQADLTSRRKDEKYQAETNLKKDSPNNTIQVIFKLANIELTPETPEYEGGTWHVEGALNEGICATAIYYYDQENITDSHLGFRQSIDAEEVIFHPEQNEYSSMEAYLGIEQEGPAVQELGKVLTKEGRVLAFPNCMQHQVQPFSLQDKSKPGYRKILAMFLIDPDRRILSTSNVPPQRRDWWADEVRKEQSLEKLPAELFDHTVGMVDDFPISWAQALEYRKTLMEQRSNMNETTTEEMHGETFSFCEH